MKNSKIIIGTEQLGGVDWGNFDVSNVKNAIKYGLDIGIRSFDTAHVYGLGLSEKRLSKLIGSLRHECEIITKVGLLWDSKQDCERFSIEKDLSYKSMLKSTQESLKNLNLDRIPVLLAHWPDGKNSTEQVIENLYKLKENGLVDKIGLSNFNVNEVLSLQGSIPIDYYQGPFSLLDLLNLNYYKEMSSAGINVITYAPLYHGMLTGKYRQESTFQESDRRHRLNGFMGNQGQTNFSKVDIVKTYSKMLGCNLKELAIRSLYMLGCDLRVIVGVKNKVQLQENINALNVNIPNEILESLIKDLSDCV